MTVCIAAMANYGTSIVIATDQMITTAITTADAVALKILGVHPNWAVMYAGSLDHVTPILTKVRTQLFDKDVTYDDIETALTKAYHERLGIEETNVVLGRFGLTMDEFLATGLNTFGEANFAHLLAEIGQVSLGPEALYFLVAGYDTRGVPHIFSVSPPGRVENHDVLGFWAIGTGQYSALGSLFFHSYNKNFLPAVALYHVCEAKFMAEKAAGVGQTSSVLLLEPEGRAEELLKLKEIRDIWELEGKPRIPLSLNERMMGLLKSERATRPTFLGFSSKQIEGEKAE